MVLLESEREFLGRVIEQLEQKTAGEIRLMIVRRSGRVPLLTPLLFLMFTTLALTGLWFERVRMLACPEWVLPAIGIAAALLALILSRLSFVIRAFYPVIDRRIAAQTRAEVEFHRLGMRGTRDGTGILLFVSLLEHQAVVLADRGIAEKCAPTTWDGVVALMLAGARQKRWAPKLEEALRRCGDLLAEHFPPLPGDSNELSNEVIVD